MKQNSGLAHCIKSNRHWDYCGNYQEMVEYIKINESEIKKELHLKLFKLIPNKLVPGREYKEWKAYKKAGETLNKAEEEVDAKLKEFCVIIKRPYDNYWSKACDEALEVYEKVYNDYKKAWQIYLFLNEEKLDALHYKMFPDCTWNGETIFSKEK